VKYFKQKEKSIKKPTIMSDNCAGRNFRFNSHVSRFFAIELLRVAYFKAFINN